LATKQDLATPGETPFKSWDEIAVKLGNRMRQAPKLQLSLGNDISDQDALRLEVLNTSQVRRLLNVRVQGEGVDGFWEGGGWTAIIKPQQSQTLRLTFDRSRLDAAARVVLLGQSSEELVSIAVSNAIVADRTVERESGPRPSGNGDSFSSPHKLCLGATPAGYKLLPTTVEFWLSGDRRCGAWATCEVTKRDDEDVCFAFRLQGHNESLTSPVRMSEGHLKATYRPISTASQLRAVQ
jgi:hypothetical protein